MPWMTTTACLGKFAGGREGFGLSVTNAPGGLNWQPRRVSDDGAIAQRKNWAYNVVLGYE